MGKPSRSRATRSRLPQALGARSKDYETPPDRRFPDCVPTWAEGAGIARPWADLGARRRHMSSGRQEQPSSRVKITGAPSSHSVMHFGAVFACALGRREISPLLKVASRPRSGPVLSFISTGPLCLTSTRK
jgi:hypothetical protein